MIQLGEISSLALSITGPNSVSISTLDGKGGSITLTNVLDATVNDYDGTINVEGGVESLVANNVVEIAGAMSDLITLDITGVKDPNTTTDKSGPAIALSSLSDLVTASFAGNFASISIG